MFVDIESFFFYSFIYTDTNQTVSYFNLKSATPFPKCYLHKEKWTFDS